MLEVEVKVAVQDPDVIRKKLEELGFAFLGSIREEDRYLDTGDGSIRSSGTALRIRTITDLSGSKKPETFVTYKGKKADRVSMTRRELETTVEDAQTMLDLFAELGFRPVDPFVCKIRDTYQRDRMQVCMDQVEDLGSFFEIEIVAEESEERESLLGEIEVVLEALGYSMKNSITNSYLSMLQGTVD